ncbi:MAG: cupin domain-containing protein [Phycisphaerae bacterium]|nr:cupin domain-containing protein [Phycisphaerae bacterium]
MPNYRIARFGEIEQIACPCGLTRRAFADGANAAATVHLVEISQDSRVHYHKKLTEIYLVLEGSGYLELDGERVAVEPLSVVMIQPGCRHRAVGRMKIVNTSIPAFDPADEWFD